MERDSLPYERDQMLSNAALKREVQSFYDERDGHGRRDVRSVQLVDAEAIRLRGDLRIVGEALFGSDWRPSLAHALKLDLASLHRWMNGAQPGALPPASLRGPLEKLIRKHELNLSELPGKIRQQVVGDFEV